MASEYLLQYHISKTLIKLYRFSVKIKYDSIKSMFCRPCFWKNIAILKPFNLRSVQTNFKRSFKIITPLFHMYRFYYLRVILDSFTSKHFTVYNKKPVLVLSYPYNQPSLESEIVNTRRQMFINRLDLYTSKFSCSCCVKISLFPACQLVDISELEDHFQKAVQSFLNPKQRYQRKDVNQKIENIYESLFPFDLGLWESILRTSLDLRKYPNLHYNRAEYFKQEHARPHWIISHFYQLKNTKHSHLLKEDLKNMLQMIRKFNFFQFLSQKRINSLRRKKSESLSHKLIRNFQWKTKESEVYLIYLSRSFGPENFLEMLVDFEAVCAVFEWSNSRIRV